MANRRLASPELQPKEFVFTADNLAWAKQQLAKYPEGRQQSAIIPLLWRAQEQSGGWLPEAAIRYVSDFLGMAHIHPEPMHVSADGEFSWEEVECLGTCVNAPMVLIGSDTYEDLTPATFEQVLDALARGETPKPGPQNGRQYSAPFGGDTTLTDRAIYHPAKAGKA